MCVAIAKWPEDLSHYLLVDLDHPNSHSSPVITRRAGFGHGYQSGSGSEPNSSLIRFCTLGISHQIASNIQ